MTSIDNGRLEFALQTLAETCGGPGAAVAVIKEGQVLVRHAWGLADRERRIPFTPRTLMPMCSITKQFTCALALDRLGASTSLTRSFRLAFLSSTGQGPVRSTLPPINQGCATTGR
jgi:D-aminopeptidase